MKLSYLIAALFLIHHVSAQIAVSAGDAQSSSQAPAATSSAAPTVDASSSAAPQPSSTQDQQQTPTSDTTNPTTTAAPVNTPTPTPSSNNNDNSNNNNNSNSSSKNNNNNSNNNNNNNNNNNSGSSSTSDSKNKATDTPSSDNSNGSNGDASNSASGSPSSSSSSANNSDNNKGNGGSDDNTNKTAVIAGSVVGGLVGLALIAGILTWVNRHGGCTSPSRRRTKEEFPAQPEDFSVDVHETPASPFQHARRFVPPTSSGYVTLHDQQDYSYNNASAGALHRQEQPAMDYQYYAPAAYDPAPAPGPPMAGVWSSPHEQHAGIKPDTIEHKPNAA